VKVRFTLLVAAIASCAALFFSVSTLNNLRLSPDELRFEAKWIPRVPTDALKPNQQVRDELDISEAVIRYTISRGYPHTPIFLSINQQDPAEEFIKRFSDWHVPLRKASETGSHVLGALIHIDGFNWTSPREVKVYGGVHVFVCGGLCPDSGTYDVVREGGTWKVRYYEFGYGARPWSSGG
jgi:hypothetical protein